MFRIGLDRPHDLAVFRDAARGLVVAGVPPRDVVWHDGREEGLFATPHLPSGSPLPVPAAFARLAEDVICHRDPERHALLYECLWRLLNGERHLLSVPADPLVHRLDRLRKAVARDIHKMHAFVRFRSVDTEEGERFVAWFEPDNAILDRVAPFFADRFSSMNWSILTPEGSLHHDDGKLTRGPPVPRREAPAEDALEDWWRTYYRATFNPARANPDMTRAEMPKRYWRNLPESVLIPDLLAEAGSRTRGMIEAEPTLPRKHIPPPLAAALPELNDMSLAAVAREASACTRCPLYAPATQTVFGAGRPLLEMGARVRLMMVGEQPGDQEDLQGKPFVGPAGQLFDRALAEAGIEREAIYVTNAVKHFKFEPRGKRRIHKKPERPEIEACRWWLEQELALVKPELVVALGATAAQALTGRSVRIMSERGAFVDDPRGFRILLTVHPSYLLRLPGEEDRRRQLSAFIADLKKAV